MNRNFLNFSFSAPADLTAICCKNASILFLLVFVFTANSYAQHPWMLKDINTNGINKNSNILNDGTKIGQLGSAAAGGAMYSVNGKALFFSTDGNGNYYLYKSDGTKAGTVPVVTLPIHTVALGDVSGVYQIYNTGKLLYYTLFVDDGNTGNAYLDLYRSDGTAAGTYKIYDSKTSQYGGNPNLSGATYYKGILYFSDTFAIIQTDGTVAGTKPIITITNHQGIQSPVAFNNKLYYLFDPQLPDPDTNTPDTTGDEIYTYNLATKKIAPFTILSPGPNSTEVSMVNLNDKYLIMYGTINDTVKIVSLNTTQTQPVILLNNLIDENDFTSNSNALFYAANNQALPNHSAPVIYKDKLFFQALFPSNPKTITYVTNGQPSGTLPIVLSQTNSSAVCRGLCGTGVILTSSETFDGVAKVYTWDGVSGISWKVLSDSLTTNGIDIGAIIPIGNKLIGMSSGNIFETDSVGSFYARVMSNLSVDAPGAVVNNSYFFYGSMTADYGAGTEPHVLSPNNWDIWTGKASSDWANINNWSNKALPDSTSDVIISRARVYPTLTKSAACKNLLLVQQLIVDYPNQQNPLTSTHVTINKPGSLTVSGYIYNFGYLNGTGALNIGGNGNSQVSTYDDSYSYYSGYPKYTTISAFNVDTINIKGGDLDFTNCDFFEPNNFINISSVINFQSDNKIIANANGLTFSKSRPFFGYNAERFFVFNRPGYGIAMGSISSTSATDTLLTLPIGISKTSYSPVTLIYNNYGTNGGLPSSGSVNISLSDTVLNNGATGTPITNNVVNKTWNIAFTRMQSYFIHKIRFGWEAADQATGFDPANSYVSAYSTKWAVYPPAAAGLNNGVYTAETDSAFNDNATTNYAIFSSTLPKAKITFAARDTVTYGMADIKPLANSTNTLTPITYQSSDITIATIVSGKIHLLGAGTVTITASQAANANYNAAVPVSQVLTINKAPLTIAANSGVGIAGTSLPKLTASYSGFVYSDAQSSLTTLPTINTTAVKSSPVGNYPITAGGAAAANYAITYVQGTLYMEPASYVSYTIPVKTYGNADFYEFGQAGPGLTYTSSNTAIATIVNGKIHITGAGTSTINVSNGSNSLNKTLTVNPAPLTITANNKTIVAGTPVPTLLVTYNGFVNGETTAVLITKPTATTAATKKSPPGTYPITVSGAVAANYTFIYVPGTLTITAAGISSMATDIPAPKVNPAISPNGDGVNDVLTISNIEKYPDNKMTIINSSGAKIFEMPGYDNVNKVFNGKSNINGKLQQAGTYFYELQYRDKGVMKSKTGYIVLKYD